ncbi:hypothetical protein HPB50_023846 [Hyalomma asiaticum]|uniref:Uncharacterized protein n=1 Tax=Hyalomma asiaticum TaxID=266040 RepID=A0ACB7S5A5_HYAAI|nr:hypothetical protein HPB50_023846 [Hyalomma asiaticum]
MSRCVDEWGLKWGRSVPRMCRPCAALFYCRLLSDASESVLAVDAAHKLCDEGVGFWSVVAGHVSSRAGGITRHPKARRSSCTRNIRYRGLVPDDPAGYFGKRCMSASDCTSKFIKGMTCNSDEDGEPGNCTCPDYTPLFLEEGGVYKCSRAGALGSSCERVEQCRYNNVHLLCVGGKCICPSPMRVKQGFKCMPEAKLGGNCSTVDSCFTRSSVCVRGTCSCRIHYAQKGSSCVYVGDTNWKIAVAYIFPCTVVFLMFSIVLLAFCSVITQRYQDVLWGHGNPPEEHRMSLAADRSNDPSSGAYSTVLTSGRRRMESGGQLATTESFDNMPGTGVRFRQEVHCS